MGLPSAKNKIVDGKIKIAILTKNVGKSFPVSLLSLSAYLFKKITANTDSIKMKITQ